MNVPDACSSAPAVLSARSGPVAALARWTRSAYDWVLHWAETPYAVAALFVLSFAEASFFPIPPDVLLIAMCIGAPRLGFRFAAMCSVASVAGGLVGYGIGALAWGQVGPWFYQYVPGFSPDRFAHVQELYGQWGVAIVFTAGFSPIPYKLFTITSGVMDLPLVPFLLASAAGRAARFFVVAGLIRRYGAQVKVLIDRYFNWLALAFCGLIAGGVVVVKWLL